MCEGFFYAIKIYTDGIIRKKRNLTGGNYLNLLILLTELI